MIIVRVGGKSNEHHLSSCPCQNCLERLQLFGFDKVVYIDTDGQGRISHLSDMTSNHMSIAQRRFIREGWLS